jgi:predicted metal-dependent phosphoesterase TrpH
VIIVGNDNAGRDTPHTAALVSTRCGGVGGAQRMSADLEKFGIPECFAGAMRHAQNPNLISRSHFARYLVEIGICRDVRGVFDTYLVPGKPGYVAHRWATLAEAVGWIHDAGGIAVVAHPGRYRFSRCELRALLGEFKDLGGQGIEVVSGSSHSPDLCVEFSRMAREHGFLASSGSDFHGPEESHVNVGGNVQLPNDLVPVWTAFH